MVHIFFNNCKISHVTCVIQPGTLLQWHVKKYVFSVLSPGLVRQRQIVPSIKNVCVKIGRSDADTFFSGEDGYDFPARWCSHNTGRTLLMY